MLSGPSGGVNGAILVARRAGYDRVVTFDMGGTSTDVALCLDGQPQLTRETQVGEFPVKAPSVDVQTIGAGGGSIASISPATGSLRVGPQSAGADPGPAAYGRGGTEATVTDANLVLGHLPPQPRRRRDDARRRARPRGRRPRARSRWRRAARRPPPPASIDIVNENMLGALRVVTVQRGVDPRTTALVAFGGAGPLHANALGRLLGAYPVIVPPDPGVLSALGFVAAGFANEFNQTLIRPLADLEAGGRARRGSRRSGADARGWLADEGVAEDAREVRYAADMRYRRQGYEIADRGRPRRPGHAGGARRALLGRAPAAVRLHAAGRGGGREPAGDRGRAHGGARAGAAGRGRRRDARAGRRAAHVGRGLVGAGAGLRPRALRAGHRLPGPAIVTQYDSTTLILRDHVGVVHPSGSILIWPADAEEAR